MRGSGKGVGKKATEGSVRLSGKLYNTLLKEVLVQVKVDIDGLYKLKKDTRLTSLTEYNGKDIFPPLMGESNYCDKANPQPYVDLTALFAGYFYNVGYVEELVEKL